MVVATQMVGGMVTDTASQQITVLPAATASYSWHDECFGKSTEFENKSTNNNTTISGYQWNFGVQGSTTDTSTSKHPEFTYNITGEYDVTLVVTNTLGCTDTVVNKVKLFQNPVANFEWSNSCDQKPVYFTNTSDTSSSAIVKWNWLIKNQEETLGASTDSDLVYSFPQAGLYNAELTITDRNGCKSTVNQEVAVNSSPIAAFSIVENSNNEPGQVQINNGTINASHYEWDFGNGQTSTALNPATKYEKEGSYTIKLVTYNGQNCSDTLSMEYLMMYKGLFVPSAFSPDNMNEEVAVFKPKGTNLKTYRVEIFDRWGNSLWVSTKLDEKGSPVEAWDGKLHGVVMKQDVYIWQISASFKDGTTWDGSNAGNMKNMPSSQSGTVLLVR
jgi:PKD repeat protein